MICRYKRSDYLNSLACGDTLVMKEAQEDRQPARKRIRKTDTDVSAEEKGRQPSDDEALDILVEQLADEAMEVDINIEYFISLAVFIEV